MIRYGRASTIVNVRKQQPTNNIRPSQHRICKTKTTHNQNGNDIVISTDTDQTYEQHQNTTDHTSKTKTADRMA